MDWPAATAVVVAVRVDLNNQRHPLHTLLRGEVCTQAVDRDKDLRSKNETEDETQLLHFVA